MMTSPLSSLKKAAHRRRQGFSLAECMISVAISATSLLGVIGMLTGTLGVAKDSKEETVSGILLRQLAGEMRDIPSLPPPPSNGGSALPQEPTIIMVNEAMQVLDHSRYAGSNVSKAYERGSVDTTATAFAQLKRVAIPGDKLMDRIVIRIETPASAPAGTRIVREYAALSPK